MEKLTNGEKLFYDILAENMTYVNLNESYVRNLNEDVKQNAITSVAKKILSEIINVISDVDTTMIDRSRGDISLLKELEDVQTSLINLEALLERYGADKDRITTTYFDAITAAIRNLHIFAKHFREAYRAKKTVMIVQYQTVVVSVVGAVNYICAEYMQITSDNISLRKKPKVENTSYLRKLIEFNTSVTNGQLVKIDNDSNFIREYYCELDSETLGSILEAEDIVSTVLGGLSNFYKTLDNGGKLTNLIYKASGIVMALISSREVLFTLFRSRFKISELFGGIKLFSRASSGISVPLSRLAQFASRFTTDAEENSKLAAMDVIDSTTQISKIVKDESEREIDSFASVSNQSVELDAPKREVLSLSRKPEVEDNSDILDF